MQYSVDSPQLTDRCTEASQNGNPTGADCAPATLYVWKVSALEAGGRTVKLDYLNPQTNHLSIP